MPPLHRFVCTGDDVEALPESADGDVVLDKANVLAFHKRGSQNRIHKTVHHAANKVFCMAFLIKHFPNSDRVQQHRNETLQTASCVNGGVLGMAAATEQRNAELADDPVQQAAHLGGTGISVEEANAPPVVSDLLTNNATALAIAPAPNGAIAMIDRMPEGTGKTTFIMRALEREEDRKDNEHRAKLQAMRDDFNVVQERKNKEHQIVIARLTDERLAAQDQRVQQRQRAEAELSRINEENKERRLAELRRQFDSCTDDFQRGYLMSVRTMIENASPTVKFAINERSTEAPVPLTQAVLGDNLADLQLPTRFNVLNTAMDHYMTLNAFVTAAYAHIKLTGEQLKTLGGLVAKAYDKATCGRALRARSTTPEGAGYVARSYPIMALLSPPLKGLIEQFVKDTVATTQDRLNRKRKAELEAALPSMSNPFAGTMHQFVVTGVPVAPRP